MEIQNFIVNIKNALLKINIDYCFMAGKVTIITTALIILIFQSSVVLCNSTFLFFNICIGTANDLSCKLPGNHWLHFKSHCRNSLKFDCHLHTTWLRSIMHWGSLTWVMWKGLEKMSTTRWQFCMNFTCKCMIFRKKVSMKLTPPLNIMGISLGYKQIVRKLFL